MGGHNAGTMAPRGVVLLTLAVMAVMVDAQQFRVIHQYADHEGSPAKSGGQGQSPEYTALLKAHDRRRLAVVADFPLRGNDDATSIGLYFTEVMLGTPPRTFYVQVDTGSDILWLYCNPCPGCPKSTDISGVTLQNYDPTKSTTSKPLLCSDQNCAVASYGEGNGECTSVGGTSACAYAVQYGDGSSTKGYFVNDVLTFESVTDSTNSNSTASIYFGCGTTQSGNLLQSSRALDGLMGLGAAHISVPTQLAYQRKVGQIFAHCLQGNDQGGGTFVIGTILESNISYTPLIPEQSHYTVGMENIAVNGVNVTTAASFAVTATGGGVIMDSGTTLAYLVEPAYTSFVTAIENGAPVKSQNIPDGSGSSSLCWVYSGNIANTFPTVTLYFDGGVVMKLGAQNYLYSTPLTSGGNAYCMAWSSSSAGSSGYTLLGDIVLKDQLVVYDNQNQRLGWKPFDCTKSVAVSAPNSTIPLTVNPGSGGGLSAGFSIRSSTTALLSALVFVILCTL